MDGAALTSIFLKADDDSAAAGTWPPTQNPGSIVNSGTHGSLAR